MKTEYRPTSADLKIRSSNHLILGRFRIGRRGNAGERKRALDANRDVRRKSKRERFLEIAEKRTQALLDKLRLLGNCGNRATYEYRSCPVRPGSGSPGR